MGERGARVCAAFFKGGSKGTSMVGNLGGGPLLRAQRLERVSWAESIKGTRVGGRSTALALSPGSFTLHFSSRFVNDISRRV